MTVAKPLPSRLPRWAWLFLPVAAIAVELGFRIADNALYRRLWESELGPGENATALALVLAIVTGVLAARRAAASGRRWLVGWLILFTLGCIYFAGEETSWGQHWIGWQTPEALSALNDQNETNLHNMSSWFDQKPRLLLELGILVGGLLYPAGRAMNRLPALSNPADRRYWIFPTGELSLTAAIAILIVIPQRLDGALGWPVPYPLDIRASETQELMFALFLWFYAWSILRRLRAATPAA
jgi:hypothetical protein